MAIRSEKLNRLVTGSKCRASWDGMQGDGERRFCAECQREVFDFAQMTARDIRARIEASRGQLCARLTRVAGQLVVSYPAEPCETSLPWESRRASPFAATLVTAWMSLGAAQAQTTGASAPAVSSPAAGADRGAGPVRAPKRPAAPAGHAALRGRVIDGAGLGLQGAEVVVRNALDGRQHTRMTSADGTFAFEQLPTGLYDLTAKRDGFDIDPQNDIALQAGEDRQVSLTAADSVSVMMGDLAISAEPLRRVFVDSDLIVVARVGPSALFDRSGNHAEVATELQIELVLKGDVTGRKVSYRHGEDATTLAEYERRSGLPLGGRVLAFLKVSRDTGPEAPSFESADYVSGIRALDDDALAAYVDRVDALTRLRRKAELRGEEDPAGLMEWLVATTEDPHTRSEAAAEVRGAVAALADFAEREGTTAMVAAADLQALFDRFQGEGGRLSEEPRPAFLGASLTENQKKRLTRALAATKSLDDPDLPLFGAVRTWDAEAATAWLVRQLRTVKSKVDDQELWRLQNLATELGDEKMQGLVDAAEEREWELNGQQNGHESEADRKLHQEELAILHKELRHRLADALTH